MARRQEKSIILSKSLSLQVVISGKRLADQIKLTISGAPSSAFSCHCLVENIRGLSDGWTFGQSFGWFIPESCYRSRTIARKCLRTACSISLHVHVPRECELKTMSVIKNLIQKKLLLEKLLHPRPPILRLSLSCFQSSLLRESALNTAQDHFLQKYGFCCNLLSKFEYLPKKTRSSKKVEKKYLPKNCVIKNK